VKAPPEPSLPAGGGVTLRPARREDLPRIAALANNRRVWMNLLDVFPHPYSPEDARTFYELLQALPGPLTHFAITVDDLFVGMAGFDALPDVHRASANIGYWLGEPYWGRGIATAAVRALSAYAFATFVLERLQAEVFGWNPASARVLEKSGYTLEGRARRSVLKAGQITDGLLYARLRGDPAPG
jgi:RimJ/RimL family protein N-acetyltransferase